MHDYFSWQIRHFTKIENYSWLARRSCWLRGTKEYFIDSSVGTSRSGQVTLSRDAREIGCKSRISQVFPTVNEWFLWIKILNNGRVRELKTSITLLWCTGRSDYNYRPEAKLRMCLPRFNTVGNKETFEV